MSHVTGVIRAFHGNYNKNWNMLQVLPVFSEYLHIIYIFRESAGIHTLKIYIYDSVFKKKTMWASIITLLLIEKPK